MREASVRNFLSWTANGAGVEPGTGVAAGGGVPILVRLLLGNQPHPAIASSTVATIMQLPRCGKAGDFIGTETTRAFLEHKATRWARGESRGVRTSGLR